MFADPGGHMHKNEVTKLPRQEANLAILNLTTHQILCSIF